MEATGIWLEIKDRVNRSAQINEIRFLLFSKWIVDFFCEIIDLDRIKGEGEKGRLNSIYSHFS